MQNTMKRLGMWAVVVAILLLIPYLAMRFQVNVYDPGSGMDGLNWSTGDFVLAGALLFGAALVYELATRKMTSTKNKLAVGATVFVIMLYVWAELAVGVFTNIGS